MSNPASLKAQVTLVNSKHKKRPAMKKGAEFSKPTGDISKEFLENYYMRPIAFNVVQNSTSVPKQGYSTL